jgi:8-oxo-dGTP pyrophosphatase MutT (NUDIX family)
MDSLHVEAVRVIGEFDHPEPGQQTLRQQYAEFLQAHPDALQRSLRVGHLTASALVMDDSRESVLLTLHPMVGRWLQLGGHCEMQDANLRAAAHREVVEESGMPTARISAEPVRLDRHRVRCSGATSEHLDVQYLALVPDGSEPVISDESDDLRWFPLDCLPVDLDPSVTALIRDARQHRAQRQEFFVHRDESAFPA